MISFSFLSALISNLALFSNLSLGFFFVDVSIFFLDVFAKGLPSLSKVIFLFLTLGILSFILGSTFLPMLFFCFFSSLLSNLAILFNLARGSFFFSMLTFILAVLVKGFPSLSKDTSLFFSFEYNLIFLLGSIFTSFFSFVFLSALTSNLSKLFGLSCTTNDLIYDSSPFCLFIP